MKIENHSELKTGILTNRIPNICTMYNIISISLVNCTQIVENNRCINLNGNSGMWRRIGIDDGCTYLQVYIVEFFTTVVNKNIMDRFLTSIHTGILLYVL